MHLSNTRQLPSTGRSVIPCYSAAKKTNPQILAGSYHFCRVHEQNADFALLTAALAAFAFHFRQSRPRWWAAARGVSNTRRGASVRYPSLDAPIQPPRFWRRQEAQQRRAAATRHVGWDTQRGAQEALPPTNPELKHWAVCRSVPVASRPPNRGVAA